MKYLKLINNFDDFAENAQSNVVYYHTNTNVYYWLNLHTIWGYIGYKQSANKFYANDIRWSIIPPVPDPESLQQPAILNSESYTSRPESLTLKHSNFVTFPLNFTYNTDQGNITVVIEGAYPNSDLNFSNWRNVDVKFTGAKISDWVNSILLNSGSKLYMDINTGPIDLSHTTFNMDTKQSVITIVPTLSSTTLSEDMIFINNNDDGKPWLGSINVDCTGIEHVIIKAHTTEGVPLFGYENLTSGCRATYDASDSNGTIKGCYSNSYFPSNGYFTEINYENVTDYGGYYKRRLGTESFQPVNSEILNLCKSQNLNLFYENTTFTPNWLDVSNQVLDLSEITQFMYYTDKPAGYGKGTIDYYSNPITSLSQITDAGELKTTWYTIYCTPTINNVNLEKFQIRKDKAVLYIKSEDSEVHLGDVSNYFYLGDTDIYITPTSTKDIKCACYEKTNAVSSKSIIFENMPRLQSIEAKYKISIEGNVLRQRVAPFFKFSHLVTAENPTPLDYALLGIYTDIAIYKAGKTALADVEVYLDGFGYYTYGYILNCPETDLSKIKCIYGTNLYLKSVWEDHKNRIPITEEHFNQLLSKIPNYQAKPNAKIYVYPEQYAYLTSEQINYFVSLGYTIIEEIN